MKSHTHIFLIYWCCSLVFFSNSHINCSCRNQLAYKDKIAVQLWWYTRTESEEKAVTRGSLCGCARTDAEEVCKCWAAIPAPSTFPRVSSKFTLNFHTIRNSHSLGILPPFSRSKCPTCCSHTQGPFFVTSCISYCISRPWRLGLFQHTFLFLSYTTKIVRDPTQHSGLFPLSLHIPK